MKRLGIFGTLLLICMCVFFPWDQQVESATANRALLQNCFAADPEIGSTNREGHHAWAQRQTSERLASNLASKIGMLFNCSSVEDEKLVNLFADISVIIATTSPVTNSASPVTALRTRTGRDMKRGRERGPATN